MRIMKQAIPIAISMYVSRAATRKLSGAGLPGISSLSAQVRGPVVAGLIFGGAHLATKKVKPLKKHRFGIMIGTGLNLIESVISAFAPADVKSLLGVPAATGEYVEVGDYVRVGMGEYVPPIDDNIALNDYITVGAVEEELGAIQQELGLEEELGLEYPLGLGAAPAWQRPYLGGVAPSDMMKAIPHERMLAPIPARSYTKEIPAASAAYDDPSSLYAGIFYR
jgi:hypothetical protein